MLGHVFPAPVRGCVSEKRGRTRDIPVGGEMVPQGRTRAEWVVTGSDDDGGAFFTSGLCPRYTERR